MTSSEINWLIMKRRQALGCLLAGVAVPLRGADVPRPAPEMTIPLANGRQIRLSDFKGKVVALEFLLTTCPGCQRCSQTIEKLYKEYGPRGFQPLAVAINDMAQLLVQDYMRQYQITYPVGYASRDAAINFLQHPVMLTLMMPQLVFIDKTGTIRGQYPGTDKFFLDEEKNIRDMLEMLLKETPAGKTSSSGKTVARKKGA